MKKIIGVLGVAVIAVAMFFSANVVNGSSADTSLAGLIAINTANAETVAGTCEYTGQFLDACFHYGSMVMHCKPTMWGGNCAY